MARSSSGESVPQRAVRILEVFDADNVAVSISDIATRAGLPLSTASRLIDELVDHGLLFEAARLPAPVRSEPFQVHLKRSNVTVTVTTGVSVLEAITKAGVPVLASCKRGLCGTCETPVISGQADHRDSLLTDAERATSDCFMPCVSRASSERLVLDL